MKDVDTRLTEELLQYFLSQQYTIISAKHSEGYRRPHALPNDGYGDQQKKEPDVYAFDEAGKRFVIGVVKTSADDLESDHSLTQYDVFFDHTNSDNGKPSRVCFLLPPASIAQFTAIITHYIHRDYWENMMIVSSKIEDESA